MPKFVKLLIDDEATMLVNLETVTKIKDGDEEGLTAIYFIGSEHPLRVKDSGQDILRKAKAEWSLDCSRPFLSGDDCFNFSALAIQEGLPEEALRLMLACRRFISWALNASPRKQPRRIRVSPVGEAPRSPIRALQSSAGKKSRMRRQRYRSGFML